MYVGEMLVIQITAREIDSGSRQIGDRVPASRDTLLDRVDRLGGERDRLLGELHPGLQCQALEVVPRGLRRLVEAHHFRLGLEHRQPRPRCGHTMLALAAFERPDEADRRLGEIGTGVISCAEDVLDLDVELDGGPQVRLLYAALLRLDRIPERTQLRIRFQRLGDRRIEANSLSWSCAI